VEIWEYAVLVTNSGYALESMAQLYRDRADAENGFDELKNQWGVAAGRSGKSHQACGPNDTLPDADARGQGNPDVVDRQYPSGHQPCEKSCGAVPTADRWKTMLDYIVTRIIPRRPKKLLETRALLAG
jgi:hypothetical protein